MEKNENMSNVVQAKDLPELFYISRSTVTRMLNRMLQHERYKKGVSRISHRLTLVDTEVFKEFLFSEDLKALKQ